MREYLTAGECRELRLVEQKHMNMRLNLETQKPDIEQVNMANVTKEREDSLIRFAVESYNGSSEAVVERLLEAPSGDFEFVLAQAEKLLEVPKAVK